MIKAFVDAQGVLICLSDAAAIAGATAVDLPEGTTLEAGKWKWSGGKWVAVQPTGAMAYLPPTA